VGSHLCHNVGLLAIFFFQCVACYARFKSFAFYFLILEFLAMAVRLLALGSLTALLNRSFLL